MNKQEAAKKYADEFSKNHTGFLKQYGHTGFINGFLAGFDWQRANDPDTTVMFATENIKKALFRIEQAVEQENYSSALEIFYRELCNESVDELEEELKDLAEAS